MHAIARRGAAGRKRRSGVSLSRRDRIILYGMFTVPFLYFLVFHYLPMAGVFIAFADFRPSGFRGWVGLANFRELFSLPYFWRSFANTWYFVLLRYVLAFPAPILLALLLNELRVGSYKKTIQTISTLPHFASWPVIAGIWISLLSPISGFVNELLGVFGIAPIFFLSKSGLFPYLFTALQIWKEVGYSTIIYLAALAAISPELYEAAMIDGAGRLQQALRITLPALRPIVVVVFVLSFTGVLTLFEPIYVLKNPMIQSAAEVLDTYTYQIGIVNARFPLATAVGLFKSTISLVMVLGANQLSRLLTDDRQGIL